MRKKLLQILLLFVSGIFFLVTRAVAQDPQTSWDIDFETDPPFNPYCWVTTPTPTYTFERANGVLKVNALDHPYDEFVFWARPFDISQFPYCDFHIKSDVALPNFTIAFKDSDTEPQQINVSFSVPADTVNWTYIFFDLSSQLGTLNTPILAEVQLDPNATCTIWFDDFRMGEAAKPNLSPPTIDPLQDMLVLKNAGEQTVKLTGITDGEDEIVQTITVTVASTNPGIIPTPTKTALAGDSVILKFTPVPDTTGSAYIRIKLKDNGSIQNTTIDSFLVVVMEDGGTGFLEDFDTNTVPACVTTLPGHSFSMADSALQVNASRSQRWYGFEYNLGAVVDMSSNPYVNVKIKSDRDFVLQTFLVDYAGNGYAIELVGTQYVYNELVSGEYYFMQNRIYQGDEYVDVCFDFSAAPSDVVDLSKITQVKFVGNGTSLSFNGTYYIDELALGDQAPRLSYIGQLPDQIRYVNEEGTQRILIPEIRNADTIKVAGAESLIENAAVESVTYQNFTENYRSETYGYSWLTFDLVTDATGTDTITLTSTGKAGFGDNQCSFMLTVTNNIDPTVDQPDSVVVKVGDETSVMLTGITDGDIPVKQAINISTQIDNKSVIDSIFVDYTSDNTRGKLIFTTLAAGVANVTVTVMDDDGASTDVMLKVNAFTSLNASPVVDPLDNQSVINDVGTQVIKLTGIGDGDGADQTLTFTATSSDTNLIPDPVVNYTQGEDTAQVILAPYADSTGSAIITVSISDDGGDAENDGDKTTLMTFNAIVSDPPVTGLVIDLSAPDALGRFKPEGLNEFYWLDIVDTLGTKALRIRYVEKWTFGGIWFDLPAILDLTNAPVVSYDILSVGNESYHWNYFYELPAPGESVGRRNIQNSEMHQFLVQPDTLTTVTFDYRDPGDMNTNEGEPIDATRISDLLINLHNTVPGWPFTNTSGLVYYMDIRFGDSAVFEEKLPVATIDQMADQSVFMNSGTHTITLTGISAGDGTTEGVTIATESKRPDLMDAPVAGEVQEDGTVDLTFTAGDEGLIGIWVWVDHENAQPDSMFFYIEVFNDLPENHGKVLVDITEKYQTIRGLGTFWNAPRLTDLYANEMGASAVRVGIIENQWEPVNDNDDPYVLNMQGFNYGAFDWQYIRDMKAAGVETFILTSWSPPAWMKRNLSESHKEQANRWENTDNILEPYYYEEFAESMVAVVRAFKEEADVDILAIGLQNEPYFNEPYASAILSGPKFAELIGVVGDRFAAEGLDDVGFFMPEQVFSTGWGDYGMFGYLDALKADPKADAYCKYFAVHGYDMTGVNSGFPSFSVWTSLLEDVQEGDNPKELWMSETHVSYDGDYANAMRVANALHGSLWAGNITLWTNWAFETMQLTNNNPTPIFWVSKNFFKFIRPGAVRVGTESEQADLLVSAYENTDGSFVMVAINKGEDPIAARFIGSNLPEDYTMYRTSEFEKCQDVGTFSMNDVAVALPPLSVTTFVAEANSILTMDQVPDTAVINNVPQVVLTVTGISDGSGGVAGLTLTFENDKPELFTDMAVSAIGAGGTADFTFTPKSDVAGVAKITLMLSDGSENTRDVTFYITTIESTSVIEPEKSEVIVYPVPAQEYINVVMRNAEYETINIRDLSGRILIQHTVTSDHEMINVGDLSRGIYLIELRGKSARDVTKFIIQ